VTATFRVLFITQAQVCTVHHPGTSLSGTDLATSLPPGDQVGSPTPGVVKPGSPAEYEGGSHWSDAKQCALVVTDVSAIVP
jgi:hypothetical protein